MVVSLMYFVVGLMVLRVFAIKDPAERLIGVAIFSLLIGGFVVGQYEMIGRLDLIGILVVIAILALYIYLGGLHDFKTVFKSNKKVDKK